MTMGGKKKKSKGHQNNEPTKAVDFEEHELLNKDEDKLYTTSTNSENTTSKRPVEDDDSEPEVKRKKKKKKPVIPEESTGKKNNKSIRQMKREKHAERQAVAEAAAKDQLKSQCMNYLSQWKHDRQNWKFMKAKQVWLFKNKFSQHLVPDSFWPILLEYFESAKGNIRNMLLADANKIIKQMDDWTESQEKDAEKSEDGSENNNSAIKPDDTVYSRARSLIQCLDE